MLSLKINTNTISPNFKLEIDQEQTITDQHTKCGVIYSNNNQEFVYVCIYCAKEFENAKLFESHMIKVHINEIKPVSTENIEEIYKFSEDKKLISKYEEFELEFGDDNVRNPNIDCKKIVNSSCNINVETCRKSDLPLRNITYSNKNKSLNENFSNDCDSSTEDICKEQTISEESFKPEFKLLGPGPFSCEFCSKIYKNKQTYRVHLNLQHSGLGPFKCHICAHSMKTKLNLVNHIKSVHKNINAPIYKCNYCELGFTSDSKLRLHIHKIHTFEKTFTCKVCGKNFQHMGNLKAHEDIHTGIKPFQCEICGKKFMRSNNMDIHKRRHLSERTVKCKLCNKMFYTRTQMQDHLITHTNEKNFSCDYCNTKFARKGDKLKHIQMKHPEYLSDDKKKYACNICKANFALRVTFKQHMKSQHSVSLGNLNDSTIPKDY